MDTTEREIIDIINNSSNPDVALEIAFTLALDFLKLLSESQCIEPSSRQALA